jgi:hypothetical protein
MMFAKNFVVNLKVDDKFIKDMDGIVKIPFGSSYSIYLKNLESRNAVVKISVDGNDVLDSNQLIIKANTSVELNGYMKENIVVNKFKFIELTKEIENYRGYRPEDSILRVEVRFEKEKPIYKTVITTTYPPLEYPVWYRTYYGTSTFDGANNVSCYYSDSSLSDVLMSRDVNFNKTASLGGSDLGITVKGSELNEKFNYGSVGELEEGSQVLILKLSGYKSDNTKVEKVFVAREKIICSVCGELNKFENKYCVNCGAFLEK